MTEDRHSSMRVLVTGGSGFIGCNLVSLLLARGIPLANLDIVPPLDVSQHTLWTEGDVLDVSAIERVVGSFRPTHVAHLAARTDTGSGKGFRVEDYDVNVVGLRNTLAAVRKHPEVEKLVFVSTQFVVAPYSHVDPLSRRRYDPFMTYGESKAAAEEVLWEEDPHYCWTIVRPTTVWGPWAQRYVEGFFSALLRGYYVHPMTGPVIRAYGYVENVVDQMLALLHLERSAVDRRVFYVGDDPLDLREWVDAFSTELTGRRARRVPKPFVHGIALAGEVLRRAGLHPPIQLQRFRSMTTDYLVPMGPTFDLLGDRGIPLVEGVRRTVAWARPRLERLSLTVQSSSQCQ